MSKKDKGELLLSWTSTLTFKEAVGLYGGLGAVAPFFFLPTGTNIFYDLSIEAICWFGIVILGIPYYTSTWPRTSTFGVRSFVLLMGGLALFYVMAHIAIKPFLLIRSPLQFRIYEKGIEFGSIFVPTDQFKSFRHLKSLQYGQHKIKAAPELIRLVYKSGTYSGFIMRPDILYAPDSTVRGQVLELLDRYIRRKN